MKTTDIHNIGAFDRAFRLVLSISMIAAVVLQTGALGSLAYVPLIAIYPGLTAMLGWDPLYAAFGWNSAVAGHKATPARGRQPAYMSRRSLAVARSR